MSELIEKFFKVDLTEAEEQALADSLLASEDSAWEMGQAAEAAYLRYGHPPVKWSDSKNPPFGTKSGLKPWLGFGVLVILGVAAVWGWKHKETLISTLTARFSSAQTLSGPVGVIGKEKKPVPSKADVIKQKKEEPREVVSKSSEDGDEILPADQRVNIGKTGPGGDKPKLSNSTATSPAQSMITPVNLEENSSRKFSDISVKINQADPGFVSLRVLDMSGLEVTPLYAGNLASGRWVFEWDGKLKGGRLAAPGYYQVEVKSGTYTGRQNIRIR